MEILLDIGLIYQIIIMNLSIGFLIVILFSLFRNRTKVNFYQILMRENRISKVGVGFVFVMLLIVYQTLSGKTIDQSLVQLLMVILGAEITGKWVNTRMSSSDSYDTDNRNTNYNQRRSLSKRSMYEMDTDDFKDL